VERDAGRELCTFRPPLPSVNPSFFHAARSRAKTGFELLTSISYGIAFSPMHAWRGEITDEELLELVRYLRELAPFTPSL
jgi:hypothetical protein